MVTDFKLGIRVTTVSVFFFVTLFTAVIAISLQYYFGQKMARQAAQDIYTQLSDSLVNELSHVEKQSEHAIDLLTEHPALVNKEEIGQQRRLFARVLKQNPLFYGLYIGRSNGDFYELINLEASSEARSLLLAKPTDRWVEISIGGLGQERKRAYRYLDDDFKQRSERFESTSYDPRQRDWYQQALSRQQIIQTDPYLFAQLQAPGQTLSTILADQTSVLGMDLLLTSLSNYLTDQGFGTTRGDAFIFYQDGEVIASNTSVSNIPVPSQSLINMANSPSLQGTLQAVRHEGKSYFAYVHGFGNHSNQTKYFGVLVPSRVVVGPFIKQLLISIIFSALLLALVLPLSWWFSSPIVRPVRELAIENEKIKNHRNNKVKRVQSHILEIDELSESIVDMVNTIKKQEQDQRDLLDSFIQLIAEAIDLKSPYTGGHCARVPELALMLVKEADKSTKAPFSEFRVKNETEWREIRVASWLHDCGKVTTPEYIVDKGTKLETIHNRIHEIRTRFEVLWCETEIQYLKHLAEEPTQKEKWEQVRDNSRQQLQDDFKFIAECNIGGEFLDEEKQQRLRDLAKITWTRHFDDRIGLSTPELNRYKDPAQPLPVKETLLRDGQEHLVERRSKPSYPPEYGINMDIPKYLYNRGELHNLLISRGTLTAEDRFKINEHMISTICMLEALPFPKDLARVPRMASSHHETLDGRGYPRKLTGEDLSIPERILAVADIFEALTAPDRPYKKGKTLSQTLNILSNMVKDNHVDKNVFDLLLTSGIYKQYANRFINKEQIDDVDINDYL
jgi:HD-GYP domain-containing protein (c-di-GMP phosphodiesterase class II)